MGGAAGGGAAYAAYLSAAMELLDGGLPLAVEGRLDPGSLPALPT